MPFDNRCLKVKLNIQNSQIVSQGIRTRPRIFNSMFNPINIKGTEIGHCSEDGLLKLLNLHSFIKVFIQQITNKCPICTGLYQDRQQRW